MKINYLQEAFIKDIGSMKAKIGQKLSADDIRADAKKIIYKEIGEFLKKFVYNNQFVLQLVPKTGIFAQDMRADVSGEWTFSNLPAWGQWSPRRTDDKQIFQNPIDIVSITPGEIHINYNLGRVVLAGEDDFPDTRSIGIRYEKLVDREQDLTKDELADKFVRKLKRIMTASLKNYEFDNKDEEEDARFILGANLIVDNIIIDLPKDVAVRVVAPDMLIANGKIYTSYADWQKNGEDEWGKDGQYELRRRFEIEDYILVAATLREKLDKIFKFTGSGKLHIKVGRTITNITI